MTLFDFKKKLFAAFLHACITFVVSILVWQLIRYWYPGELKYLMNTLALYKLLIGIEIILGPLISLVIYSAEKSIQQLAKDYLIVGIIQCSALLYGLGMISGDRPLFLVLSRDRLELVRANDLDAKDVDLIADKDFSPSLFSNTKIVCVNMPVEKIQRSDLLASVLSGKDIFRLPKYYRKCKSEELLNTGKKMVVLEALIRQDAMRNERLIKAIEKIDGKCAWLPFVTSVNVVTAIVCSPKNEVTRYLNYNSI